VLGLYLEALSLTTECVVDIFLNGDIKMAHCYIHGSNSLLLSKEECYGHWKTEDTRVAIC